MAADHEGSSKLKVVVAYAEDVTTCRKTLFERHFSHAQASTAAFSESTDQSCDGICDNCSRVATVEERDVTAEAWKVLKILTEVSRQRGRVTLTQAVDLVRGLGSGSFGLEVSSSVEKSAAKGRINYEAVCEGKVALSKPVGERPPFFLSLWSSDVGEGAKS